MKKISYLAFLVCAINCGFAYGAYSDSSFRQEVRHGLDIVGAERNIDKPDVAPGELGADVYQYVGVAENDDYKIFIPASMYLRLGGGINLDFATDKATFNDAEYKPSDSWTTQIGLGWNLSSYVRGEVDFQQLTFSFSGLPDAQAQYQTLGGMLYFDLARRYVQQGDITRRRTFVPFIGIGAGFGHYQFEGEHGAGGLVFAAPRAVAGLNVMFTDLIGIDVYYQYQMMIGDGFGWSVHGGVDNISNFMAALRVNF